MACAKPVEKLEEGWPAADQHVAGQRPDSRSNRDVGVHPLKVSSRCGAVRVRLLAKAADAVVRKYRRDIVLDLIHVCRHFINPRLTREVLCHLD